MNDKNKKIGKAVDNFLTNEDSKTNNQEMDCSSGTCVIKGDKSLLERINKKIITEDGRELLF
tara:strand:- start:39141 stop:39326 length:186 start_codon:yes stop_codon:yes gene_type:complete